ncbi:ABC transporter permease [Streptomyces sp. MP131-18]|uniref:ABC transporter permease n=1 Tax=Streptomyces sp. MP131-18 TaxID=1857892 RepID=UPI0009C5C1D1|nr:ABC transporter permease [Streptomyces sp. MP131-18]ONK13419.1 lipoprotein releasing system, transmembrane protein, LolC/E family [Streptomyces sp. MP131-18]
MLGYALQTLRARKAAFAGAFLALLCAAALVTACGALLETGLRGEIRTERYAATPVVVAGDQNVHHEERKGDKTKHKAKPLAERVWLPEGTAQLVADVPGVGAVVPELTFPAALVGQDPENSLGHAWSSAALTPFRVEEGGAPRADGDIVIDRGLAGRAGLAPGDRVTVQSTGDPAVYTVTGIATTPRGAPAEQSAVFFTDAEARRLAGHPGQDTVLGVFPADGVGAGQLADRVAEALAGTPARVHTGDGRGPVEFPAAEQARVRLISMGGAIGGTGLLVAVLVVAGTFALTAQQRRRELALLRAVAATPRQVRRLIGREALLVGLAAGLLGALAGLPLAGLLHDRFTALGAVPETLAPVRSPFPPAAALPATLLTAWVAARVSARRAARIRPAVALTEAAGIRRGVPLGRLIAGLAAVAGGAVLLAVLSGLRTEPAATPVTYLTVLLLCVAVALLGPLLARAAFAVLGAPLRLSRVPGHLAAHNARAHSRRLAAVITPLTLLVALTGTVVFSQTTLGDAAERQAADGVLADWTVTSEGPGVPPGAAQRLREVPGVAAVTEVVHGTVRTPGLDKYTVQGVTPDGIGATLDPGVTAGSLSRLTADGVAVSEQVADSRGLAPGDELALVFGDGTPATLTVVAVYERGLGFGDLTLAHERLAAHLDNPLADSVLVAGAEADRLTDALADLPGLAVRDGGHTAEVRATRQAANAEVAFLGMGLVLAFTAIASVNTLAMSTADRAAEFALLRRIGTTRRQVLRMLRLESLTVAATAAVLGTAICLATLTAFSSGMTGEAAPSLVPGAHLAILAAAAALAMAATAVPGRLALRAAPAN